MIEKFGQRFAAHFGIVCRVGQFLQVFNAAEGFRRAFGFESLDVSRAVDEEANQFRERGRIAGFSKSSSDLLRLGFVCSL